MYLAVDHSSKEKFTQNNALTSTTIENDLQFYNLQLKLNVDKWQALCHIGSHITSFIIHRNLWIADLQLQQLQRAFKTKPYRNLQQLKASTHAPIHASTQAARRRPTKEETEQENKQNRCHALPIHTKFIVRQQQLRDIARVKVSGRYAERIKVSNIMAANLGILNSPRKILRLQSNHC